eukprot:6439769-Pyramimonas_sp.AAC.1
MSLREERLFVGRVAAKLPRELRPRIVRRLVAEARGSGTAAPVTISIDDAGGPGAAAAATLDS